MSRRRNGQEETTAKPRSRERYGRLVAALLVLASLTAAELAAQGIPSGLRVSVTNLNSLTADFDVTLYTTYPFTATPTGYLGNRFVTPTFGYVGTLLNPVINAIEYGDGSTIAATNVPLVAPGSPSVFRGSFSHTYPASGNYPLRAGVAGFLGYTTYPYYTVATGNAVAATAIGFSVYSPFASTTTYLSTTISYPFIVGITATPGNNTPAGGAINGGSGVTVTVNVFEIPTLSQIGLLLVAMVLAGAGVVLLRR